MSPTTIATIARRGTMAGRGLEPGAAYAAAVLADSPAVYMKFNEATVAPVDATGVHIPTVVGSGITSIADGPFGNRAYRFPNSIASRIGVPDHASLDVGDTVTLECWYRPISTTAYQALISKGQAAYYIRATNVGASSLLNSQLAVIVTSTVNMTDTARWYHVVATKAGATAKLYIDGVDRTGTVTNSTLANNGAALSVGVDYNTNTTTYSEPLNGDLAQVAVYGTALSAARVSAHFAAGV